MEEKYKSIENEEQGMACEPLGGSAALAEEDDTQPVKMLDSDIIGMALEIALREEREGKLVPLEESFDMIFEELGWK